jgi:hypothetical protein
MDLFVPIHYRRIVIKFLSVALVRRQVSHDPHDPRLLEALAAKASLRKNATLFCVFPYVCPEPVLVKDRFHI